MMKANDNFICLDIGTTTLRCLIINLNRKILGSSFKKVELIYPDEGRVEINPKWLLDSIKAVVNTSMYESNITAGEVKSLGISTQRGTFITWRKDSGEPFHNFITWKDVRSRNLTEGWNNSIKLKVLRSISYILYVITGNSRYLAGSKLKMACSHTSSRLLWVLKNTPNIQEEIRRDNVMFGTLETWLIYNLTKGKTYVTDISNASATGFFDPFTLEWGSWAINILKIPRCILPPIVDNDYDFGMTEFFGGSIKISTVLADQSASMLGSLCINKHDLKVTIGTGAFINENTGDKINVHLDGMYPLVGWKFKDEITYIREAPCSDAGSLIEWLKTVGFIKDTSDLENMMEEYNISNELFFIPAFSGLGPPVNDDKAGSGFIGIQPTTKTKDLVFAVLESIIFRVGLALDTFASSSDHTFKKICIDGGVSRNEFICQNLAHATNLVIEKDEFDEIAALGISLACFLSDTSWKEFSKLINMRKIEKIYEPDENSNRSKQKMIQWRRAADRFTSWQT